jgi:hypothetical protein
MNNGQQLKQEGINRAADNAEYSYPGWSKEALSFLKRIRRKQFMTEDVRKFAYDRGLPHPPHERSWGQIIQAAIRMGIIKQVGYGKVTNPKAHMANAAVWSKC